MLLRNLVDNYPLGVLSEGQKKALQFIISKLEISSIQSLKQQAYVIATIYHETAFTYLPVKEYGSLKYLMSKPYYPYIGRGFVQITWKENYKRFGDLLKIDLVEKPDLALESEISWRITELGMTKGLFTGKKLSDYFDEETDWINARRIINKLDKAEIIADYAKRIYWAIDHIEEKDIPLPNPPHTGG